jgi:aryl-alcohol dehydrogenase-like predicted oxidoreductase
MEYRKLGKTGLKVSEIGLGSLTYGAQVEEADAIKIIERAISAGVNFFDTADVYVGGRAEEIVGKALKEKRHSFVLATKVSGRTGPGGNDIGLSRKHILDEVEKSLRRLGTDYIDLYQVHFPDLDTPIDETLRTLDDLVHQGKVRYIGCSNFHAWELCKALRVSDLHNLAQFDSIQTPYNLLTRDIENELLPLCTNEGIGIIAYNILAGGLLTGKHDPDKPPAEGTRFALERYGPRYRERYWTDDNFKAVVRLKQITKEYGRNLTQFALSWVLAHETVSVAVCGATSVEQLEESLGATEIKPTEKEVTACNKLWEQFRPPRFDYGRISPIR